MLLLVLTVVNVINWWYVLFSLGDLSNGIGRRLTKEESWVFIHSRRLSTVQGFSLVYTRLRSDETDCWQRLSFGPGLGFLKWPNRRFATKSSQLVPA